MLAPGFVDPHVHLRTPGREDEEDIASGTKAAAAGGYCAILAMPNTDPVVDSAAVLGALVEQAKSAAAVPVGFLASISKGQDGEQLTEMIELAEAGAAGFTDDGRPVVSASLLRRALQYVGVAGGRVALHEEDPSLSNGGHMHEGPVSAELGLGGWPSVAESTMVARDLALAAYEQRPLHLLHVSARESVEELRRARAAGIDATAEVTPHHLCLTDEAVRSLDTNLKMNPPLRAEEDRQALISALTTGRSAPWQPITPRMRVTRRTSPSRRLRSASRGSRRPSRRCTRASSVPECCRCRRCSSGSARGRPGSTAWSVPGSPSGPRRISSCSTSTASGASRKAASARGRRTRGCWGRPSPAASSSPSQNGRVAYEA